ncbi:hypothetical protein LTS12_028651, partial [Elasticomyces elasticus]
MGSPAGTSRLEMKPEHVLQPRPQTPPSTNDQHNEPVKTPGRSTSQPRPSGANFTPDQQSMRRPGSMGSIPTTVRSRNNSVVQLQTPKSPRTPQRQPTSSNSSIGNSPNAAGMPRSLRRTGAARTPSNDLRSASRALEGAKNPPQPPEFPPTDLNLEHIASSSSYDPVTDKGKRPVRGMSDVIEAWGETPSSPRSPSRPASVRRRRSMQHLQELECRMDQLIAENRSLTTAREAAEDKLSRSSVARRRSDNALNTRDADLRDRSAEVDQLKDSVEWFQKEVSRLTSENERLMSTNTGIAAAHAHEVQAIREASSRQVEQL